jgi:apolipoprotein D and lipocalin family protein
MPQCQSAALARSVLRSAMQPFLRFMLLLSSAAVATASLPARSASTDTAPLQAVSSVDLGRYMGHWYQIAFYPNQFQAQCVGDVTADYKLLPYGQVEVINQCRQVDGSTDKAVGRARLQQARLLGIPVNQPYSTARLEVRFAPSLLSWLPQVWAPYWVIQLADDYRYTVVSEPTRQYLWILSRAPALAEQDLTRIKARLQEQGFDVAKLVAQPQTSAP